MGEDGQLETMLLALKEIFGKHTGENLLKYVLATVVRWGIASKLGYLQMDNASNNDTLIQCLSTGNVPRHRNTHF